MRDASNSGATAPSPVLSGPSHSLTGQKIDVGDTIGRFIALRRLGEGAMGVVYAGFDMQLDRKVAIKVIRAEILSAAVHERAIREAQALAKLSHPNVVQVYEAGTHQQRLFVAMEYVDGLDMRQWLETEKPPWRVVLATIIAAGRGLAAAHAIGLIHRDVKPDNILIGSDGRARIADFGLVRSQIEDEPERDLTLTDHLLESVRQASGSGSSHHAVQLTQEGRSVGTPAYMAPEQHRGRGVDARSDQFSLCVTLYEGVYGKRPFTARTVEQLRAQVEHGEISPPPPQSPVPRGIHRAIVRGLQPDPDARWTSLDALLEALGRDPYRRWRWIAGGIAAATVVAAGAYGIALTRAEAVLQCQGGQEIASAWGDEGRTALAQSWTALEGSLATETRPRVERMLDAYAERWVNLHDHACEEHRRGGMSSLLLDRTMACLRGRRQALRALVDVLVEAADGTVTNAVEAAANLPRIDYCGEAEALLAAVPPPEDRVAAAEVEAIRGEFQRVAALERAGRYADGLALADSLDPRIVAVSHPPLVAEAHLHRGRIQMWAGEYQVASESLHRAFILGLEARVDETAAEALVRWIYVVGSGMSRMKDSLFMEPVARAMVRRVDARPELGVLLDHNLGAIYNQFDSTLAIATTLRALNGWTALEGPLSPHVIYALHNLSDGYVEDGRCAEGQDVIAKVIAGAKEVFGERHPTTIATLLNQCLALDCAGEREAALSCFVESRDLFKATFGETSGNTLLARRYLAQVRFDGGDADGSELELRHILATVEDPTRHLEGALARTVLGQIALARGDLAVAQDHFQSAFDTLERLGAAGPLQIRPLVGLGEVHLARGDLQTARSHLEAALTFAEAQTPRPWLQASARFALALVLARSPEPIDRARARSLAHEASEGLAAGGRSRDGEHARITRFLATVADDTPSDPPPTRTTNP